MQLIGMLDSPFVRRVAISLKLMGLPFEHHSVSVFRHLERFQSINPIVKAPTLVCDDGVVLMDSTLIVDYLETLAGSTKSLMPPTGQRRDALQLIGLGLAAAEKAVQVYYEQTLRPAEKQHAPWLERVNWQLLAAYDTLEPLVAKAKPWLMGNRLLQPDITIAVAWRFTHYVLPGRIEAVRYPALADFCACAEELPEFVATPLE